MKTTTAMIVAALFAGYLVGVMTAHHPVASDFDTAVPSAVKPSLGAPLTVDATVADASRRSSRGRHCGVAEDLGALETRIVERLTAAMRSAQVTPADLDAIEARIDQRLDELVESTRATYQVAVGANEGGGYVAALGDAGAAVDDNSQELYESVLAKLDDAQAGASLTFQELGALPELQQMPPELRDQLLGEVAERLTRGELDPQVFLSRPADF